MAVAGLQFSRSLFAKWNALAGSCIRQRWFSSTQSPEPQAPEDEFHVNYLDGEKEGVVVFSMRRFRYKNSMGRNIIQRLLDGMNQVRFDNSIRCIILRSVVPGVFCAGADLKERAEMTNDEVATFVKKLRFTMSELAALPVPTIAAIDGAALGGGLEMALACDLRIAGSNAQIGLIETSRALIPGAGGTQRLPRTVGVAVAKEMIFTSRRLSGQEAKEMGVVNHVVTQNKEGTAAYLRALDLAQDILPQAPIAVRMAKLAINQGIEVDIQSGMKYEEAYYAGVIPTKDRIEGLNAFKEKRKPVYKGH